MNEDAIAAELKAKLQVEEPAPEPAKEEPKTDERFLHDGLPLESRLEKQQWLDYFQVPSQARYDGKVDTWLQRVLDWARDEAGSSEYTDILRVISDQERILGSKIKPDRLATLARFATIRRQRIQLAEQERALYG